MANEIWCHFNLTKSFIILFICCLGLSACISSYDPNEEVERHIVVELEIAPGEDPTALIHLTNSILDPEDGFFYPDSADVNLAIDQDSSGRMAYAQSPGLFTSPTIQIEEGETYFLRVDMPTKGVETLYASTTVPFAEELISATVDDANTNINIVGNQARFTITVDLELPVPVDPNTYFHLIPSIINGEEAAAGNIQYDQLPKDEFKILTDNTGFLQFIHKNGIFIDNSRIESHNVTLQLIYFEDELFIDNVDSVSFTLRTINLESMVYHENTDRELRTSSTPLDDPQISANNIENGFGLFGAYSSSTLIVPIN